MDKFTLTCNCYEPPVRADITVQAANLGEAWELAIKKFCRKYKAKKSDVSITATHHFVGV